MQEQQSAMMDSLHQQLTLMKLAPEQEQAYIAQYKDTFYLQEQQLSQQIELSNSGSGQTRSILVCLISRAGWIPKMQANSFLQKVSYLMVVEIPSDDQIATARHNIEESGGKRFGAEVAMEAVDM